MRYLMLVVVTCACCVLIGGDSSAQRGWRRRRDPNDRNGVPNWDLDKGFKDDVFTFVRIRFRSNYDRGYREKWRTDYRDSDLNFSFRLQQLTSLKTDPEGLVLDLTDPRLFDYPFVYMCEPGDIVLDDDEVAALRRYLLNGGFLMTDDYWGEREWFNFEEGLIKRVFPDREWEELPPDHEIFHCVYPLAEKPQVPSIGWIYSGVTYERPDAKEVHFRAMYDDNGRMMALFCHNTDLGDGWEREGENHDYFREFSEKKAYPMGINIVFYVMTH